MSKYGIKIFTYLFALIFPLTVFADQPATTNWTSFQGNPQHNGYVPVTVDPNSFQLKWIRSFSAGDDSLYPFNVAVTTKQLLLVTDNMESGFNLYSMDTNTGETIWQKSFSNTHEPDTLTIDNNKLFLRFNHSSPSNSSDVNPSGSSDLIAYDIHSGAIDYDIKLANAFIYGVNANQNRVCFNKQLSSQITTLSCYSEDTGTFAWQNYSNFFGSLMPVMTDNIVANASISALSLMNLNDGRIVSSANSFAGQGFTIIDSNNQNIITATDEFTLMIGNIKNLTNPITVSVNSINIVAANNTIYEVWNAPLSNSTVTAIDESSGKIIWSTTFDIAKNSSLFIPTSPIVTNNLLFITSQSLARGIYSTAVNTTYAVDLKTHQVVWKSPGMLLALANNTLYLIGDDNSLIAMSFKNLS